MNPLDEIIHSCVAGSGDARESVSGLVSMLLL